MKANELMIGDWVLVNGNPMQIQAINDIDGEIMAGDELYCLIEDRVHSEDKIEPIPLTAEILEKNGFKVNKEREMVLKSKDYDIGIDFYLTDREEPLKSLYWYSIKKNNPIDGLMPLHYAEGYYSFVHELQHALRLCGIDKEIE